MVRLISVVFLIAVGMAVGGEVPSRYSLERYAVLWKESRFHRSGVEEKRSSDGWSLVGIFRFRGEEVAVLHHEATGAVEEVSRREPSPSGLELLGVCRGGEGGGCQRVLLRGVGRVFWVERAKRGRDREEGEPSPADLLARMVGEGEKGGAGLRERAESGAPRP